MYSRSKRPERQGVASSTGPHAEPVSSSPAGSRLLGFAGHTRARITKRNYPAWLLAAALLMATGTTASVLASRSVARNADTQSRAAFDSTAAEIASNVKLSLQGLQELTLAAGAFVAAQPNLTEPGFLTWGRAIQFDRRYPELSELAWIGVVPAAQLPALETRLATEPGTPFTHQPFKLVPAGPRPFYCLSELSLNRGPVVDPSVHQDLCASLPLLSVRDSGQSVIGAQQLPGGIDAFGAVTPVYRGGAVPTTVASRRRAFLGFTAILVVPSTVLKAALRGHPGMAVVLIRPGSLSPLVFTDGRAPHDAQSVTTNLNNDSATVNLTDGSTLVTSGAVASGGIFDHPTALWILISGITLSALLTSLLLVLGTGRARALRMVHAKTRELSNEVERSSRARDDAVEASNAKSIFVATVSHELRTPLAGVIGTAELLMDTELTDEQREYVEITQSSSEGLMLVINDILDYSKIEAGKLELDPSGFALSEMIAESCALMLPVARRKGIQIEVKADPDLPAWLHGDAGRLHQVLINLLSNAVKFTEKGSITVHASATPQGKDSLIRVEVTDTGIGIDEETLARLFQPFTQADSTTARRYGGTGLGLTISGQLIEMMGGTIGVVSRLGEGATFWFQVALPVTDQLDQANHTPGGFNALGERDSAGELTDSAPLVLVAEDNPVNQMLAARQLDKCGYRSEVVSDGNEALAAIARTSYAAVLMDCQMPGLDGYDATLELRRREGQRGHLPVIATTAHSMSGDREKCLAAGMDDYLSKPIRAVELRDMLARVIAAAGEGAGVPPTSALH
jgi:signal transduction histidine kinase/CheY-like chemotaxis protein